MLSNNNKLRTLIILFFATFFFNNNVNSYPLTPTHDIVSPPPSSTIEEYNDLKYAFDIARQKQKEAEEARKEAEKANELAIKALAEAKAAKQRQLEKEREQQQQSNHFNQGYPPNVDYNNHDRITTITTTTTIAVNSPTESPITIYSNTDNNPSKQQSDGSYSQVNDPNSSTSENSSSSNSTPQESSTTTDSWRSKRSNFLKLVIALSVVGGFAGLTLIAGILLLTRREVQKRQKQQKQSDEEVGNNGNSNNNNIPPSPSISLPPPNAILSPLPSNNSNNKDNSNNNDDENPFSDPVRNSNTEQSRTLYPLVDVLPSAPPPAAFTAYLDPYTTFRQNRTLSMLSQTTMIVSPSAPTAKELDALNYDNINPFEEGYGQNLTSSNSSKTDLTVSTTPLASSNYHEHLPNTTSITQSSTSLQSYRNTNSSLSFFPPPAYTVTEIIPNAPPLYVLPSISTIPQESEEIYPTITT